MPPALENTLSGAWDAPSGTGRESRADHQHRNRDSSVGKARSDLVAAFLDASSRQTPSPDPSPGETFAAGELREWISSPAHPPGTGSPQQSAPAMVMALADVETSRGTVRSSAATWQPGPRVYESPVALGPFEGEPHHQVVRAVQLQWRQGVGEARLRLQPEHLGEVAITLRVEHGHVSATVRADSPVAAEWIRLHHADLQSSLASQGLDLESLDVLVDPESRRRHARQDPESDMPRPQKRRGEPQRFDIHV
jgi:hypothetical protein